MVIFLYLHTGPVFADGAAYFERERNIGPTLKTADGYFRSCKAELVIGGFFEAGGTAVEHLHQAITYCGMALKLEPDHYNAKLSLAAALSYEGKRLSKAEYPKLARKLLEQLTEQAPENPDAYGALGTWHMSVSKAGFLARLVLKASNKKAKLHFQTAHELGGQNCGLLLEHAKFLALDKKADPEIALKHTEAILNKPALLDTDALFIEKARLLKAILEKGYKRKKDLRKAISEISAFPGIKGNKSVPAYDLTQLGFEGLPHGGRR